MHRPPLSSLSLESLTDRLIGCRNKIVPELCALTRRARSFSLLTSCALCSEVDSISRFLSEQLRSTVTIMADKFGTLDTKPNDCGVSLFSSEQRACAASKETPTHGGPARVAIFSTKFVMPECHIMLNLVFFHILSLLTRTVQYRKVSSLFAPSLSCCLVARQRAQLFKTIACTQPDHI